jgi:hypothetical protein
VILYLDTSAAVKLYASEPGSAETRPAVAQAEQIASSLLGYVEPAQRWLRYNPRQARIRGIDPRTVAEMLLFSVPPGYRRSKPPSRPKLDPFREIIEQILEEDKSRPS